MFFNRMDIVKVLCCIFLSFFVLYQTFEPFQKRAFVWFGLGWGVALHRSTLNTAATLVYLHVYHLADSIEQLGAVFQILLGFIVLVSAVVMPYISFRLTHSFSFISFMYGFVVSFKAVSQQVEELTNCCCF